MSSYCYHKILGENAANLRLTQPIEEGSGMERGYKYKKLVHSFTRKYSHVLARGYAQIVTVPRLYSDEL